MQAVVHKGVSEPAAGEEVSHCKQSAAFQQQALSDTQAGTGKPQQLSVREQPAATTEHARDREDVPMTEGPSDAPVMSSYHEQLQRLFAEVKAMNQVPSGSGADEASADEHMAEPELHFAQDNSKQEGQHGRVCCFRLVSCPFGVAQLTCCTYCCSWQSTPAISWYHDWSMSPLPVVAVCVVCSIQKVDTHVCFS